MGINRRCMMFPLRGIDLCKVSTHCTWTSLHTLHMPLHTVSTSHCSSSSWESIVLYWRVLGIHASKPLYAVFSNKCSPPILHVAMCCVREMPNQKDGRVCDKGTHEVVTGVHVCVTRYWCDGEKVNADVWGYEGGCMWTSYSKLFTCVWGRVCGDVCVCTIDVLHHMLRRCSRCSCVMPPTAQSTCKCISPYPQWHNRSCTHTHTVHTHTDVLPALRNSVETMN